MSDNNEEFDSEFFREAVADAKTIRETAIENAKDHLEEAFTPKLRSMLSQTIQQEMEQAEDENGDEEEIELDLSDIEDAADEEGGDEEPEADGDDEEEVDVEPEDEGGDDEGDDEVEIDIDTDDEDEMEEITDQDELDLENVMEFLEAATMDDRHDDPDTSDDRSEDNPHRYDDEMLDTGEFEDGYESDNQEPIMDDVNKLAQELEEETELQEELEDEMVEAFIDLLDEEEGGEDEEDEDYMEESDETVFDVDLKEFGITDTDRDPMDGMADVSDPYDTDAEYEDDEGNGVDVGNEPYDPEGPGGGADERNRMDDLEDPLEEETTYDLSALLEEDDDLTVDGDSLNEAEQLRRENQELKEELGKHRQAIKILREKINETNLINSKLLYTNRLFKKFGLNDRQKMKVIESFDRASNTREAKLVYTTLAENFNKAASEGSTEQVNESRKSDKKERLVEALEGGLGSEKTGGSTTPSDDQKQILNENEGLKDRFQKLANIDR